MPSTSLRQFALKMRCRGFTLVEMMIVVAIMAILLAIAVPSFNETTRNAKLTSHANAMVASVNLARGEAIKRNATVTLCASSDGTSCAGSGGWHVGWIVACRTSDHAVCDASGADWMVLHRQGALSTSVSMTETSDPSLAAITFMPTGLGATAASMLLCQSGASSAMQRLVTVTATGRAAVSKTTASCS